MATLDFMEPKATAVMAGAALFHELRARLKDIAFNHPLAGVDPNAHWQDSEDSTDYMMMVQLIQQSLASVGRLSPETQEGFVRSLAHVLYLGVSGCSANEHFDVIAETGRAYEFRTEPTPEVPGGWMPKTSQQNHV